MGRKFSRRQRRDEDRPLQGGRGAQQRRAGRDQGRAVLSPPEISAMILQKLKRDAEAFLGDRGDRGGHHRPGLLRRRAAAGHQGRRRRSPGFKCKRIVNEPTAASLAYGLDKEHEQTVLVFDLGGGTFDVSILELGDGVFEVKSTNGDTHLGGDNFDKAVVDWIVNEFRKEKGVDLTKDRAGAAAALRSGREGQGRALLGAGDQHQPAVHHHGPERPAPPGDDADAGQARRAHPRPARPDRRPDQAGHGRRRPQDRATSTR